MNILKRIFRTLKSGGEPAEPAAGWRRTIQVAATSHNMRTINRLVVHCSATRPDQDIGADEIRLMHTLPPPQGNGWHDIGYHFVIRRDGKIELGRPLFLPGAHVKGHNRDSIGICLVGGINRNKNPEMNFTDKQMDWLTQLLKELVSDFPTVTDICGHRDLSPDLNNDGVITKNEWLKDCPCFDVRSYCAAHGITTAG